MQGGTIVRRVPSLYTFSDQAVVSGTSCRLAVVMGTGRAFQESEPVIEKFQSTERVRNPALKPAQHASAYTREHRACQPRLPKQLVKPVNAPQRQKVRRIPTADVKHILVRHECRQIVRSRRLP